MENLLAKYQETRNATVQICEPLQTEDYVVQSMEDVSPPKWHLGHTTWFFERIILNEFIPNYQPINTTYFDVFNSYYKGLGNHWLRPHRGHLSRPTVDEVISYRKVIDQRMSDLMTSSPESERQKINELITVGIQHEQQHQELLLMDIKHNMAIHPEMPAYRKGRESTEMAMPSEMISFEGGLYHQGSSADSFSYDNERPEHQVFVQPFRLQNRPVTNGEFLEFIQDGGYQNYEFWLSDGWDHLQRDDWKTPLYWENRDGQWFYRTLTGAKELEMEKPVCHVNYYEALAYAYWKDFRLPTEAEWEFAAKAFPQSLDSGHFLESGDLETIVSQKNENSPLSDLLGNVWEWTSTAYLSYPGYRKPRGPLLEYNSKFMSGQIVLKGGAFATPRNHIRTTYRNFYQPEKQWAFSGFRLAEDI